MNFFLDTEFHEDGKTIDLISIALVGEDGRAFYALNKECDLRRAMKHDWVRENVLLPIYKEHVHGDRRNYLPFTRSTMRMIFDDFGMSRNTIKTKLLSLMDFEVGDGSIAAPDEKPVIWAYFADYDWVAFCQLFGRMVDLPKGMPFFCMDLKQRMVERGLNGDWKRQVCPDPEGEHNALIDARWNAKLYEAIGSMT